MNSLHHHFARLLSVFLLAILTVSCQTPSGLKKDGGNPLAKTGQTTRHKAGLEKPSWNEAGSRKLPASVGTKDSYSSVDTSLPFIALTFDDGPHPSNTPRLLDILKERNVKATFYVVATNARTYPEIMRRIIAEGHEIGNHTVTHGNLRNMSKDGVRKELTQAHDAIVETTGVPPRTMRPPYGAISSDQKEWIREEYGYPSILWSVDPEDWKRPGSSVVASRLVKGTGPGGILLVHDIHEPTIDAIPSAVDQLLAQGYQFVTVTQLIALDGKG